MRKSAAFTLIELLVVMAIILVLAGITLPMLLKTKEGQFARNATAEIELLKSALEKFKDDTGDYPPTFLADIGDPRGPDVVKNQGNKLLVTCLATTREKGPYLASYILDNADKGRVTDVQAPDETVSAVGWGFGDDHRYRELLDPWGTPYIYLHNQDYGSDTSQVYNIEGLKEGSDWETETPCTVTARRDDDGVYYGAYSFQLWSCGPNRINDNGGEDDITSWQGQ